MAGFNANRLRWIRIARGMTMEQLAGYLRISKQAVSKYENGKATPSSTVIHNIMGALKISHGYLVKDDLFFNSECSALFFRTKSTTKKANISFAEIMNCWGYEILTGLESASQNHADFPKINTELTIPEKALELRRQWNIENLPIKNMVALLESKGFYIFTIDSKELETDAYSRVINGIPVIVINKNKGTAVRQRFSLAHELGHLILHKELSGTDFGKRSKKLEKEASLFAEHFLMPVNSFRDSIISLKLDHFISLKKEWGVSIAAMLYHCSNIGIIDGQKANSLQVQLSTRGWKESEPLDDERKYEVPEKLYRLISQQITNTNSFERFFDIVRLPVDIIEQLCSLPRNFFGDYFDGNTVQTGKQLALFPEEGIAHA